MKEKGHANTYENLKVKYIMHHVPELVILDGDVELEKIQLSPYSTQQIHELMRRKGFRQKALWSRKSSEGEPLELDKTRLGAAAEAVGLGSERRQRLRAARPARAYA